MVLNKGQGLSLHMQRRSQDLEKGGLSRKRIAGKILG